MRGKGRKRQSQTTSPETRVPQKRWVLGWGGSGGGGPGQGTAPKSCVPGHAQGQAVTLLPTLPLSTVDLRLVMGKLSH